MPDATYCYCLNGDYIGAFDRTLHARTGHQLEVMLAKARRDGPEVPPPFCPHCGKATITACQHCQSRIDFKYHDNAAPAYCQHCGKPFPWTETAIQTAKEFTDELEDLSYEDKIKLKDSFVDLTADTARTPLAASRFKMYVKKIGPVAGDMLVKIIVSVMTEGAMKLAGLK
jgi:hypothetical protein